jgi:nicotinamidase-related amidase
MNKKLVVIDVQNDFITGSLGTPEAQAIVPKLAEMIKAFDGEVIYTQDTHYDNYPQTQEGRKLPIQHCVYGSNGWQIHKEIDILENRTSYLKDTFGSIVLADYLADSNNDEPIDEIILVGVCTDICVVSNAMLIKAILPEVPISVVASCCAGTTPENHRKALDVMACCQINIIE